MDNSWEGVHVESSGALLSDLIVHDDQSPNTLNPNSDGINFNAMTAGDTVTVRNSIVYNIGRGGMLYQGAEAIVVTIENCTVVNTGTSGMNADGQAGIAFPGGAAPVVTVTNTISVGVDVDSAAFTKVGDDWGSSSNNLSSDASAPGPDSLIGIAAASLFVDTSLGIEDFHLAAGAVAIDAGVELPDFLRDIDGELRQAGAWDIGADEQL
jgi:hypothetical protein